MVRRAFANALLSLLLATTLVWGGCISCEQYFMWPGAKSCCSPGGHCKTSKIPGKQSPDRPCNQIAFDHQKSVDLHIDLPVVAIVRTELPLATFTAQALCRGCEPIDHSPPDLQLLHSTFLI
jgi:hypothetical protein